MTWMHGDVVGFEMLQVKLHALEREQVHGYRIAGKGIDHQNIELPRRLGVQFAFHLDAHIALHDFDLCWRVVAKGEEFFRDADHVGIDLVKSQVIARSGLCGQRASSPRPTTPIRRVRCVGSAAAQQRVVIESDAHAAVGHVIRRCPTSPFRIEVLDSVFDPAVGQDPLRPEQVMLVIDVA